MLSFFIEAKGLREVNRYLSNASKKIRMTKGFMKTVGVYLTGEFKRNMIRGIDPEGKALPPPARWTRIAGKEAGRGWGRLRGKMVPLNNTGRLRGNLKIQSISKKHVEVGFAGKYLDIARRMIKGAKGNMEVSNEPKKHYYSGIRTSNRPVAGGWVDRLIRKKSKRTHDYIRVKNDGQWITRQVSGGSVVVKPIARNFFFLSKKQVNAINGMVDKKVAEALK